MAKSMTKKPVSAEAEIQESIMDIPTKKEIKETSVKSKKKFSNDDLIPCRSVTNGKYVLTGKVTKTAYKFMNYGDIELIDYADLRMAVNNTSVNSCCYSPKVIVEDEDFINEFPRLKEFYESMYTTEDYANILSLPLEQMKEVIAQMPEGSKECIKGMISTMIFDGRLDSVRKIQALDSIFGTQMQKMLAEQ